MKENYVLLGGWSRVDSSYQKIVQMTPDNSEFIVISHDLIIPDKQIPSLDKINKNILKEIKRRSLSSFMLIGHSLGGGIAISFVASYPKYVKKLILIDSEGIPQKRSLLLVLFYLLYDNIFIHGLEKAQENIRALYRVIRKCRTYLALARYADSLDLGYEAQKINLPTIIIWGEKDRVTPIDSGKELHRLIRNSKLKILQGMGHDWILHYPQGLWENIYG